MDTIKKIILVIFLSGGTLLTAQDNSKLQEAFSKAYTYEYEGNYTDAIQTMKSVYNENSYEINLRLGWLTYLSGLFTESMPYYQKCISLKPLSIEARLGIVYPASALGNWTQVESYYNQILLIDPQNTLVNYRMGLIFYGRQDYNGALQYFEKVVNLYPFDYDSVVMLAWTNFQLNKFREAKVLFNKALLIQPNDDSALEGLGLME